MRPYVCVPCGREMKCEKNGVVALEKTSEKGEPYKIFLYDKWKCPGCDHEVLVGHGDPIYTYDKDFERFNKEVEITFY